MTDSVSSEFSSFLRLLIHEKDCRFFDEAKKLIRLVKSANECGLPRDERDRRMAALSDYCRLLIRLLEDVRDSDFRYRIPLSVREMGLSTLDAQSRLILLGCFQMAVQRFEHPDKDRRRRSESPPGV